MPKATSKGFKKKKYNARFPPARIKKIMQTDEEVGKVAAAVPVIISRALEMFIESLIMKTAKTTQAKNAKTLSTSHIKQTIYLEKQFDFLLDLVKDVPDHQAEDNNGDAPHDPEVFVKKGRGRPRKSTDSLKPGRKSKSNTAKTSSDTSDEEEDDEQYEDEDTETDEDAPQEAPILTPSTFSDRLLPVPPNMAMANNGSFPGSRGFHQAGFSGAGPMSYSPSQSRSFVIQCPPYLQNIQNPVSAPPPISHLLTHLMPQNVITPQENTPINLSNPIHRPAVGTNEDDDYDS